MTAVQPFLHICPLARLRPADVLIDMFFNFNDLHVEAVFALAQCR